MRLIAILFCTLSVYAQGLRAKTMEDMVGGLGPEGGIEGTAFALAADGTFHRAGLEHFGGDLS